MKNWQEKKIVVTGATGLLGSVIVRTLLAHGCRQVVAMRRATSRMDLLGDAIDHVAWVEGDLLDPYDVVALVQGSDIVIHAAAMVSFAPGDREKLIHTNTETTRLLVNACLEAGVTQFIFISSVAAIGRLASGKTITEASEWVESKHNTNYAISKYRSELEAWRGSAEGLPVTILNPSIILGAGYWQEGSAGLIGKVASGMPYYGTGATAVVDVRDVAAAALAAIEQDAVGERLIIAGHNISYKDLLQKVATHLEVAGPKNPLPKWLGRAVARIEVLRSRITGKQPLITPETVRTSRFVSIYDNSKSQELLGIQYRPLQDTLSDIAEVYHQPPADYGLMPLDTSSS